MGGVASTRWGCPFCLRVILVSSEAQALVFESLRAEDSAQEGHNSEIPPMAARDNSTVIGTLERSSWEIPRWGVVRIRWASASLPTSLSSYR